MLRVSLVGAGLGALVAAPLFAAATSGMSAAELLPAGPGGLAVAVDAVGAKPGDWVICVGSSAAREAAGSKGYPSDLTIVGIIDKWPPEEDADADPAS